MLSKCPNAFAALVKELSNVLEPQYCLKSEGIDPKRIMHAMERYVSRQIEWEMYALPDFSRGYTRNLVHKGNGKCNLVSALHQESGKEL